MISRVELSRKARRRERRKAARFQWRIGRKALSISATFLLATAAILFLPSELTYEGRISLLGFLAATVLWTATSLPASYSALLAVMLIILLNGQSADLLFSSLSSEVVWLILGAFVIGGAMEKTGIASRLADSLLAQAKTTKSLLWLLTTAILPLSIFVPSTSGRAAVMLPVYRAVTASVPDSRFKKAVALLIPTVILLSTTSTLIGAASHLIGVELLRSMTGEEITFLQWMLWGLPVGILSSYLACAVILWSFLPKDIRGHRLPVRSRETPPFSREEKMTAGVLAVTMLLWLSEPLHGLELALVTMLSALVLCFPSLGVMKWKEGLESVSWNLIVFVGAALALGNSLIDSGAAEWLSHKVFAVQNHIDGSEWLTLILLILLSVTSHLYITSHTTRAMVLVPAFLYMAGDMGLNPAAVLFIATAGMNFCLTFPVSSKALLIYQEIDPDSFRPSDLLQISGKVGVSYILLIIMLYYTYWQWTGLQL